MFYLDPRVITAVDDTRFGNNVSQQDRCPERQVNPEFSHSHQLSSLPLGDDTEPFV